jgi:vacuolar-type H+-ATPase subunit I/STV1
VDNTARIKEIEAELQSLSGGKMLTQDDIESVNDNYQDALERNYYRQELRDELNELKK